MTRAELESFVFKKEFLISKISSSKIRQKAVPEKERIVNLLNKKIGEKLIKEVVFRA